MIIAHFSAAFFVKAFMSTESRTLSLPLLLFCTMFVDIINTVLVVLGIEWAEPNPHYTGVRNKYSKFFNYLLKIVVHF